VTDIVNSGLDSEKTITDAVKSLLHNETKRRPMVFVTVTKA
jgi:mRNA degradation ribonuclease J1/J2